MKRKITSVIISLILFVSLLVPVQATAAALNENFIGYGGFESSYGYNAYGGWGGSFASIDKSTYRSGSGALRLNGGAGNPWVARQINNLIGGSTITLSFWYKSDLPERTGDNANALFGVKFEGYVDAVRTDYAAGAAEIQVTAQSVGEWTQAKVDYTLDERANIIVFYFRMYNMTEGTVYVDDAELCMTAYPPLTFAAKSEQVFYYSDTEETQGCVTVSMNDFYDDADYTADFKFMSGLTVQHTAEGVEFKNHSAEFTYPLELLKTKKKEYKIKIAIKNSAGEVIEELTEYAYKYDRPKSLSADGVYTDRNGKEVKPVMAYHTPPFSDTEAWEAMVNGGINVIQYVVPADLNQAYDELDKLYEMGCYAAVVCYLGMKPAGNDANFDRVFNIMSNIADHPAVFCWMTMDEPYLHNKYAGDDLRKSYKLLRSLNDYTPVYICECTTAYMAESAKYCDILAPDPYPANRNSYGTFVSVLVNKASVAAAKQNKLVMGILQCCTVEGGTPTALQVHSMILQSYLSGGKAHGWYAWEPDYTDIDESLHKSPYWDALMKFHRLEEQLVYDYYVKGKYETFNVDKPGDIEAQTGNIWYETFTDGDYIYGIIQNRTKTAIEHTLPLTSENGLVTVGEYDFEFIYDGAGNPTYEKLNSGVKIRLEAYQAVMFKITPAQRIDTEVLNEVNLAVDGGFEEGTGWTYENIDQSAALITNSPAQAKSGNNYISLKGVSGVISTFEGEPGKTYILEAYCKSDAEGAAKVQLYDSLGRGASVMAERPEVFSEWTPVRAMITVGESISPNVKIHLANVSADATVCFDNVIVKEAKHTEGNMILNGHFEADVAGDREWQSITNWQSGNAIKLTSENGNNILAVRQQNRATGGFMINNKESSAAAEGDEYAVSFKIKDDSAQEGKLPWVRLLTYKMHSDGSLTGLDEPIYMPVNIEAANVWTYVETIIALPAGTNYVKIDISSGAGWTFFDDFSFTKYKKCFEVRNAQGEEVKELPMNTEYIEVSVVDAEKQGVLFAAQYKVTEKGERLAGIVCSSDDTLQCRLPADKFVKGQTVIKMFLWADLKPVDVKILK